MNSKNKLILHGHLFLLVLLLAGCATQPPSGRHPAYLHALSDLRTARWVLEHRPGDAAVSAHESEAISEIDHAIAELKRAAIDDGKNIHDHPSADVPNDYRGRLHKAADLLRKVHADTYREEDNPDARGLRDRAIGHVDAALRATEQAIHDVEAGRWHDFIKESRLWLAAVEGLSRAEARALLDVLIAEATRPEFTYQHSVRRRYFACAARQRTDGSKRSG